MTIKQSKKNRLHYVYENIAGISTRMSTPFKNAKRATKLTITNGNTTLDLNGRQVRALRNVIAKATSLSSKR